MLREVLTRRLPDGMAVEPVVAMVTRIEAAGRAAWPAIGLDEDLLAERIAERLRNDPEARSEEAHDADVYLAIALAASNKAALEIFEAELVPQIDVALRRLRLPGGTADEVKQALRFELLVGDQKIADYAGRGELAAWIRVSATRKALKISRKADREETLDEILLDHWPATTPDPAVKHLRSTYTAELKTAIRAAFAALEVRQRNLLRQHILDELTIDDLARLYRVHRATCARWLADARADLGRNTRKRLIAALGVPGGEVDSLLRFLDSDIELSISRILMSK
ncbi:MAG: putative DNA-binding regulatory protein [Myxococcales bacterium]|nr:putative DNA-binding regulatory protein [Myxococcales bacterium]